MTTAAAYFPRPLPEELDIGHLARAQLLCGYSSHAAFLRALGATRSTLGALLVSDRWGPTVVDALCKASGLSSQSYTLAHTLLQYSHGLRWDMPRRSNHQADLARLGKNHSFYRRSLRYCQQCCAEQERQFGMRYWLREHQLPGMDWCLAHEKTLMEVPKGILEPFPGCITPGAKVAVEPRGFAVPLVGAYLLAIKCMLHNREPLHGPSLVH